MSLEREVMLSVNTVLEGSMARRGKDRVDIGATQEARLQSQEAQ